MCLTQLEACAPTGWARLGHLFYIVVEKHGYLFHHASRQPFKGILVNPSWIMDLLQSRKLGPKASRELVVNSCSWGNTPVKGVGIIGGRRWYT